MTAPIDITDPRLAKAYAHPLRAQILGLLDNRVASPSEISVELGAPIGNTSYHVRQLVSLGLVKLVNRTARRGAIEHHYTAAVRPTITDEAWAALPDIVKRASIGASLEHAIARIMKAAHHGGFDRSDVHYSRTSGRMDARAWRAISKELAATLRRIERIVEESDSRLGADPHSDAPHGSVIMMLFEEPSPHDTSDPAGDTSQDPTQLGGDAL